MEQAFLTILKRDGKNVVVTTNTPQTDIEGTEIRDEDGQPVFDEEENTFKAMMNIQKATKQITEGMILKPGDCLGQFPFRWNISTTSTPNIIETIDYLNSDSYVLYDTLKGVSFYFEIIDVVERESHWEVPMKRIE